MKTIIGSVVLVGVITGIYLLNSMTRTEDGKSILHVAGELPITVKTTLPERRTIIRRVQAPGEIEACLEVDISSELVSKIVEMPVEEGDQVKEGDLLCRLDDADYRARLRAAEAHVVKTRAALMRSEADFTKAERDYNRQKLLSETDSTSALELADYHTTFIRAKATLHMTEQELVQAESAVQSAEEDLAKTVIASPIDGIVSQLFAKQGEVVITGTMNNPGTRIMVVSDLSKMQARCRVDEADVPLVESGQPAKLYFQSDVYHGIPGHVLRVAAKGVRPMGRDVVTFETLVLVDSDDSRVRPGMNANVQIEVATREDALSIPVEAVVQRKRKDLPEEIVARLDARQDELPPEKQQLQAEYIKIVFVNEDEAAKVRLIETGISDETGVEVLTGVNEGDIVVTGPYRSLDQLKQDAKLKLETEEKNKDDEKEEAGEDKAEDKPADEPDADSPTDPAQTEASADSEE
jgi:HlyD family secretion protein